MTTKIDNWAVVTTIQKPTASMVALASRLTSNGMRAVIVGDAKGPAAFDLEACDFLSLETQKTLSFSLAPLLPTGHYARKNLGYLTAMQNGAKSIYETDDDNAPMDNWSIRSEMVESVHPVVVPAAGASTTTAWCNVYRIFAPPSGAGSSDAQCPCQGMMIWPRGLPLDHVRTEQAPQASSTPIAAAADGGVRCSIQQGLADGAPDVDAIWRLLINRDYHFGKHAPILLPPRVWCPFNSQNTWWFTRAFPLMYLPSFCSFRMTDIWRSFIAQRCIWEVEAGSGVEFHSADVLQDRNDHSLMRDFTDEVPGYTRNSRLCELLGGLSLAPGPDAVGANLLACYTALAAEDFFPQKELDLVRAWLADVAVVLQQK